MTYFIEVEFADGSLIRKAEDPEDWYDEETKQLEVGEWLGSETDDTASFAFGVLEAWWQSDDMGGALYALGKLPYGDNDIVAVRAYVL